MKRHGHLLYAAVPPNVVIVAGTVSDYWAALARVERDQQEAAEPAKPRARKPKERTK